MAPSSRGGCARRRPGLFTIGTVSSLLAGRSLAQGERPREYIYGSDGINPSRQLAVDRYPALFSRDWGNCLNGTDSSVQVARFDVGLYEDNATVLFHLQGASNAAREDLMVRLSVDAYGANYFNQTIDPCNANATITSLCPLVAGNPVRAWAKWSITPAEVAAIPPMAFTMPDIEVLARLQMFSKSSGREVGCYQALLSNGLSLSHPEIVAPVTGGFALIAMLASFLAAAYGISVPHMRMHYAHSLPVLLVFETLQGIFLSGALSVEWPGVLVAWYSNFAWSAGMIYEPSILNATDAFASRGGTGRQIGISYAGRQPFNRSDPYDYTWAGGPVAPGLPLPGTQLGFPATLAGVKIPAGDAFSIGLIWFAVVLGATAVFVPILKLVMECLVLLRWIKDDRLAYFRSHYLGYAGHIGLRVLLIGMFMLPTLAIYQLTIEGTDGVVALAAAILACLVVGIGGFVVYACYSRVRLGKFSIERDAIVFRSTRLLKVVPFLLPTRRSTLKAREVVVESRGMSLSLPFIRLRHTNDDPSKPSVHLDQPYVKRLGALSGRYRRSRWWFFACYIIYQLGRAAFLGAGSRSPPAQVYGLFAFEILAFVAVIAIKPFEGARNTALAVWMLGISKIITTGLSISFLPGLNLARTAATSVGIVIIAVQGLVVAGVIVLVVLSVFSTWLSMSRNRADFYPELLDYFRPYYFENMHIKAEDDPNSPEARAHSRLSMTKAEGKKPEKLSSESSLASGAGGSIGGVTGGRTGKGMRGGAGIRGVAPDGTPSVASNRTFSVSSVRRRPKIGDEDEDENEDDVVADMDRAPHNGSMVGLARPNRASSNLSARLSTSSLQQLRGARPRRTSWSSKDIALWDASMTSLELQQQQQISRPPSIISKRVSGGLAGMTASPISPVAEVFTSEMQARWTPSPQPHGSPRTTTPRAATPTAAAAAAGSTLAAPAAADPPQSTELPGRFSPLPNPNTAVEDSVSAAKSPLSPGSPMFVTPPTSPRPPSPRPVSPVSQRPVSDVSQRAVSPVSQRVSLVSQRPVSPPSPRPVSPPSPVPPLPGDRERLR